MKNTYLFDFDGTLVDSMPTFISAMLRILDENKIKYEDNIVQIITPLGLKGTADYFIGNLGLKLSVEQLTNLMKEYMLEAYFNSIPAKEHVIDTLVSLKKSGCSLNVLTASPHVTLDACLKRLNMWEFFDNVWSCDDFATTKADPHIYRLAAQRLGTTVENVLFLDDNVDACKTAKAAGAKICGVYDLSSKDYAEEIKKISDYYIFNFSELLSIKN